MPKRTKTPITTVYVPAPSAPPPPPPPPPSTTSPLPPSEATPQPTTLASSPNPPPPSILPPPPAPPPISAEFTSDPIHITTWGPHTYTYLPPSAPKTHVNSDGYLIRPQPTPSPPKEKPKIKDGYAIRSKSAQAAATAKREAEAALNKGMSGFRVDGSGKGAKGASGAEIVEALVGRGEGEGEGRKRVSVEGREESVTSQVVERLADGAVRRCWVTRVVVMTWETEMDGKVGEEDGEGSSEGESSESGSESDSESESGTSESGESDEEKGKGKKNEKNNETVKLGEEVLARLKKALVVDRKKRKYKLVKGDDGKHELIDVEG